MIRFVVIGSSVWELEGISAASINLFDLQGFAGKARQRLREKKWAQGFVLDAFDGHNSPEATDAMLNHTVSAVVFTIVGVGVSLQVLALVLVGIRIARNRVSQRWQQWRSVPRRGVETRTTRAPLPVRRRCRDYRLALGRRHVQASGDRPIRLPA